MNSTATAVVTEVDVGELEGVTVAAVKARRTNSACASMKNAKGLGRVSPFSLSRIKNAARPLPVDFVFYHLFSSL